jgi:hypothetical protein
MPPTNSPKKDTILAIGLDKPTREIIAEAKAKGVKVSGSYVELLKQERPSRGARATAPKKGKAKGSQALAKTAKPNAAKPSSSGSGHPTAKEKAVVLAAFAVGIDRAIEIVQGLRGRPRG